MASYVSANLVMTRSPQLSRIMPQQCVGEPPSTIKESLAAVPRSEGLHRRGVRVLQEEAQHLPCRIGPAGVGV